jgi:hypothetical protein
VWPYPWITVLLSVVTLAFASAALRESLNAFSLIDNPPPKAVKLGWPFDSLSSQDKSTWWRSSTCYVIVAWLGWCACVIVAVIEQRVGWDIPSQESAFWLLMAGGFASILRLLEYASRGVTVYFRTRLRTRRWIVPETDALFVPSLAILAITGVSALLIVHGIHAPFVIPPFVAATAAAALLIGPDPFTWHLTCQGNLRPRHGYAKLKRQPTPGK